MSRRKPWFQFNSDAFLSATIGWPGDLKGFYALIIILLDARNGKLPDDVTMFARATGYRPKTVVRLLNALRTLAKLQLKDGFWSYDVSLTSVQRTNLVSKPLKYNKSHARTRSLDKIEREKKSLSSSSSLSQSAGARAGEMEAPASPAPPEQKQADKTPQLSEEERAAFVRKILGREVLPGRVERPELHRLLEED
jgi:hypothetical protein